MTATALASAPPARPAAPHPNLLSDVLVIAQRDLLAIVRQPTLLVFVVIQPVMFTVLFRYVFGGAIETSKVGGSYVNFLLPGIITQTIAFGSTGTAIALAGDMQKGIIDRFRSLPMSRSAVIAGRVVADVAHSTFTMTLMCVVGVVVGWRPVLGPPLFGGLVIAMGFGVAMSWVSSFIGLLAGSEETAQSISFVSTFPLTFASAVFVPVSSMPGWLQGFAKINPITLVANTVRATTMGTPVGDSWWQALAWIVALSIGGGFLAVRRYSRTSS